MTSETSHPSRADTIDQEGTRRDFLFLATGTVAAVGTAAAVWPLIDNMNPSADVLALSSVEVDIEPIALGQRITVSWRGQPLFITRRTPEEIAKAKADDTADLPDPEPDSARVQREEWHCPARTPSLWRVVSD